jgi:putative phosphoribosyl transferase
MRFRDRTDAGQQLGRRLSNYAGRSDVIVLALPRGGVPVACEVARQIKAPMAVWLVRKLGVPDHPELAMGAIAEGGFRVLNAGVINMFGVPMNAIEQVARREQFELERRARLYRGDHPAPAVRDRIVILIDDGLATGSTMQAAVAALRQRAPAQIIVAAPVGATTTCEELRQIADDVVCLSTPEPFNAVGLWYEDFSETSDEDVTRLLSAATLTQVPS